LHGAKWPLIETSAGNKPALMTQAMSLLTTPDGTTLKGIRYSAILAVLSYYGPRQGRAVELPRNKAKAGVKEERQDPLFFVATPDSGRSYL